MSSYAITADWTTLPTALLPLAKQHMRVDFSDDDTVITEYLKWAISYFEKISGWQVFGAAVDWLPDLETDASRYQCPVQPVASFTVMSGAVDVSAEYELEKASLVEPVWLARKDGTAFHDDAEITLTAGYTDITKIEPSALAGILRVAGTLYEHRESITTLSLDQMPFWLNDLLGGHWIPRA
jgi:uncharacterized phiE125 gp8 family phage protein